MNFNCVKVLGLVTLLTAGMGCKGDDKQVASTDAACASSVCTPPDMTMAGPVLDFSVPKVADINKNVVSDLVLPKSTSEYAFDVDGNGTKDNRLGGIMQALTALGFNPQSSTSVAVLSGQTLLLFTEQSSDPTLQNAPDGMTWINSGVAPLTPPLYDGTDSFTVDNAVMPAVFGGAIANGVFTSVSPATATTPVTFTLKLALLAGQAPLVVPMTAGHVKYTRTGTKLSGEIHGAIKKTDMDTVVLPAIAVMLTTQISTNATIGTFDTNKDGTITAAELQSNFLIANLLSPDVQMFNNGAYAPQPNGAMKDCLSFGLAFQAVGASF